MVNPVDATKNKSSIVVLIRNLSPLEEQISYTSGLGNLNSSTTADYEPVL